MKKILVLYASQEGQTAKIARVISGHLEKAGVNPELVNVSDASRTGGLILQEFDFIVFGGSLHEGAIEKSLRDFINAHSRVIAHMPRSFFLVSLSAAEKDETKRTEWLADARQRVEKQLDVVFDEIEMIAGALKYTRYNWLTRFFMKRIVAKAGGDTDTSRDYEYTDWLQVADYAHRLAASLS